MKIPKSLTTRPFIEWSVGEIIQWLSYNRYGNKTIQIIKENEIDGQKLWHNYSDVLNMKVIPNLGLIENINNFIVFLKTQQNSQLNLTEPSLINSRDNMANATNTKTLNSKDDSLREYTALSNPPKKRIQPTLITLANSSTQQGFSIHPNNQASQARANSRSKLTREEAHNMIHEFICQQREEWFQSTKPQLQSDKHFIYIKSYKYQHSIKQSMDRTYYNQLVYYIAQIIQNSLTRNDFKQFLTTRNEPMRAYMSFRWVVNLINGPPPSPQLNLTPNEENQAFDNFSSGETGPETESECDVSNDDEESEDMDTESIDSNGTCFLGDLDQDDVEKLKKHVEKESPSNYFNRIREESIRKSEIDPTIHKLFQDALPENIFEYDTDNLTHGHNQPGNTPIRSNSISCETHTLQQSYPASISSLYKMSTSLASVPNPELIKRPRSPSTAFQGSTKRINYQSTVPMTPNISQIIQYDICINLSTKQQRLYNDYLGFFNKNFKHISILDKVNTLLSICNVALHQSVNYNEIPFKEFQFQCSSNVNSPVTSPVTSHTPTKSQLYTKLISDFSKLGKNRHSFNFSPKFLILYQLVDRIVSSNGEKLIVFSSQIATLKAIQQLIQIHFIAINCLVVTEATSKDELSNILSSFNNQPTLNLILCSSQLGIECFRRINTTRVIFYDSGLDRNVVKNTIDSIHQIGTTQTTTIYCLFTHDTVESHLISINDDENNSKLISGQVMNLFNRPNTQYRNNPIEQFQDSLLNQVLQGHTDLVASCKIQKESTELHQE